MDHDKQVTDLVQVTRDRFLNQDLRPDEREKDTFNLELEFAKSAKNRSIMIPVAVAIFLVVLGIGAWIASQFTDQASQKSTVSIGSFEDLKLKEIFDTARKNKQDLENVQLQITQLTQASTARATAIQQAGQAKADVAGVDDPSGTKVNQIHAETDRLLAAEKASLNAALRPLKEQADAIQKKIDSYDDRIGQMNKKNQQILDSQQRLNDLEKQKMVNEYEARIKALNEDKLATVARLKTERDDFVAALKAKNADDIRKLILKYNPNIKDAVFGPLILAAGTQTAVYPRPDFLPDRIGSRDLVSADLQNNFATRVDKVHQLLGRVKEIPFENSVPPLLNALDVAIADALVGYNGYLAPLAQHMTDLDGIIAQREATIAERDASIAQLKGVVEGLKADLAAEKQAAATEKAKDVAWLARWTGSIDDYIASFRDWDGLLTDVRVPDDVLVVLKPERGLALASAITAAAAAPPPVVAPGKTPPKVVPVNLAVVRDGISNGEVGIVSLATTSDGGWRATLVKQNDPKRPIKAFDRLVLQLPKKK